MATIKFPRKPKGKLSVDRDIAFTKKFIEVANKIASKKAAINGLSTEREKLAKMRKEAKENALAGKKTNKKL